MIDPVVSKGMWGNSISYNAKQLCGWYQRLAVHKPIQSWSSILEADSKEIRGNPHRPGPPKLARQREFRPRARGFDELRTFGSWTGAMLSADGDGTSVANGQNFGHFPWLPFWSRRLKQTQQWEKHHEKWMEMGILLGMIQNAACMEQPQFGTGA